MAKVFKCPCFLGRLFVLIFGGFFSCFSLASADRVDSILEDLANSKGMQGHYARRSLGLDSRVEVPSPNARAVYSFGFARDFLESIKAKFRSPPKVDVYNGERLEVESTRWTSSVDASLYTDATTGAYRGRPPISLLENIKFRIGVDRNNKKAFMLEWGKESFLALPQSAPSQALSLFLPNFNDLEQGLSPYSLVVDTKTKKYLLWPSTSVDRLPEYMQAVSYEKFQSYFDGKLVGKKLSEATLHEALQEAHSE